jgi:phosphatidylglycerophosphate synthase
VDYFNPSEKQAQLNFATRRDAFFKPALIFLRRINITPNHVSLIGFLCLIGACIFPAGNFWSVSTLIALYCLMDALDGGMARLTGAANEGGALVDIIVDQAGPVLLSAAAIVHLGTNPVLAVLFSNFYIAFIALAIYANEKGINIGFFVRVKYVYYAFYGASFFFDYDLLTAFMAVFSVYYFLTGFFAIGKIYRFYRRTM